MILRVTEGSLAPVDCLTGDDNPCARQQECVTLKLWKELDGAIRDVVDGYTLDDRSFSFLSYSRPGQSRASIAPHPSV